MDSRIVCVKKYGIWPLVMKQCYCIMVIGSYAVEDIRNWENVKIISLNNYLNML